jgi:hypothetical protein
MVTVDKNVFFKLKSPRYIFFQNIYSKYTSRLDAADDDVADFIVSDLLVATSIKAKKNQGDQISIEIVTRLIFNQNVLAAALVLRETALRFSLSPSLPKTTCIHAISCIIHSCPSFTYSVQIK